MISISLINKNRDEYSRIDVISLLKLKPDKLYIEGYYLSRAENNLIMESNCLKSMNFCFINGDDNSFFKEEKKRKNIIIKKVSRFELMEI